MRPDLLEWLKSTALVALLVLAAPAAGADGDDDANPAWFPGEFTANVAFTSDYVFRGISQTNERGAIQGGIDWSVGLSDDFGIYAGGWGSNVDFTDGDNAQVEIDMYGGLSGSIGDLSLDATVIYYRYPGAKGNLRYDFVDFGPSVAYDFGFAEASVQYLWSPDYFAGSGDSHYITGGLAIPIPESALPSWLAVSVDGSIAHQEIDEEATFGARDYASWDVGATLSAFGLDVDLRYFDTDLARDSCFGGGSTFGDLCDARFVWSVSKSF